LDFCFIQWQEVAVSNKARAQEQEKVFIPIV